jgi:hypothetical protein
MLESTFIHLPDFGYAKERALWQNGIKDWDGFLDEFYHSPKHGHCCSIIESSKTALELGDARYFSQLLKSGDTWRCFPHFDRVVYVDIETTGLGRGDDYITVIGLFDGSRTKSYIQGKNLIEFTRDIKEFDSIVTFNGSLFDVPFIQRAFPKVKIPPIHVDLRFVLASLGIRGGLKKIEAQFGMEREDDLKGLNGYDAVKLWKRYKTENDLAALDRLVRYNSADIENLKALMEFAYKEKRKESGIDG